MKPVWLEQYDYVPEHGVYAQGSLYEQFRRSAYKNRYKFAVDYFGATLRYDKFLQRVEATANVLHNLGLRPGERVCICLPNMPDAAALFYAVSRLGGVSVMVHPLSTTEELARFLQQTEAAYLFLMDVAYVKHKEMLEQSGLRNVVCCSMWEDAPWYKRGIIRNAVLQKAGLRRPPEVPARLCQLRRHTDDHCALEPYEGEAARDTAVIMFSGGSSAEPKGIRLSAANFAALAGQVYCQIKDWPEEPRMMAILPFFHGFGLGVCMHAALIYGMTSIMVARFNAKEFSAILRKKKPHIITGVPTLYEALLREKSLQKTDLSFLKGVFVGGDACPAPLKERMDYFLKSHGASVTLKEGYGLTETVAACVVTPPLRERSGSIGVPLPDVFVKICGRDSLQPLPCGEVGEIVISSPTLMLGYLEQADTDRVIFTDESGRRWLRTGDLGRMDAKGYLYFEGRIKRIVKVSGFPVYPGQIEQIIEGFDGVARCCCVSVPDDYKINVIKAIVQPAVMPADPKAFAADLLARCKAELSVYGRPRVIELLPELPVTKVGKVDWKALQQREDQRRNSNN